MHQNSKNFSAEGSALSCALTSWTGIRHMHTHSRNNVRLGSVPRSHQLSSPVEYRHRRSCESRGICPFISNFSGSRRRTVHSSVYNFIKISYPVTISGTVCLYPSTLRLGSHCNILREMLAKCNSAIRLPFKVFPLGSTVSIVTAFQEAWVSLFSGLKRQGFDLEHDQRRRWIVCGAYCTCNLRSVFLEMSWNVTD